MIGKYIYLVSFLVLALSSCRKDNWSMYEGDFTCLYHLESGVEGYEESKFDTLYTIYVNVAQYDDVHMEFSGGISFISKFNNGFILNEDLYADVWKGGFQSSDNFHLRCGNLYWGHYSYRNITCERK